MVWLHASKKPIGLQLNDIDCRSQGPDFKPKGMWLGAGSGWLNWVKTEMPELTKEYKYMYKCYLKRDINVFNINTFSALKRFTSKYGIKSKIGLNQNGLNHILTFIDWSLVCQDYDGIMVTNYSKILPSSADKLEYLWFRTYDIDSACIWKPSAVISSLQRI